MKSAPYTNKSSASYQLKSFRYAWQGIQYFFRSEVKAKIHISAGIAALILGGILEISLLEWAHVILLIGLVVITEILNTAIELIGDSIDKKHDRKISHMKDLAAGAVLVAATTALIGGALLFIPKMVVLFS